MDRNIALEFVRVTEAAARAAAAWNGRGDGNAADKAATEAMRQEFNFVSINGTVVIGEGERDEAPMLFIGEKVGAGGELIVDIAVDPLECTNSVAKGGHNAMSVIAAGKSGCLLHAPDAYMEKIAVCYEAGEAIDITQTPAKNLHAIAECLRKPVNKLTVVILDRERHFPLISEVRQTGARIRLITDGDVSGAIAAALPETDVDVLMGIGAAPEGVLAAAAIRCIGGAMQCRFSWRNDDEIERAMSMGITQPDRIYTHLDLARGDVIFAATGITDGDMLQGVETFPWGERTYSFAMRSKTGTVRKIITDHKFGQRI